VKHGTRALSTPSEPIPFNAAEDIPAFDTSEHEVSTEEEPNALTGEEMAAFLACMKEEFPAQYDDFPGQRDRATPLLYASAAPHWSHA